MKFHLQNYNEFKDHMRWHDYFSFIIHEFTVILVRRYDFGLHEEVPSSTFLVQLFGFTIYNKAWEW